MIAREDIVLAVAAEIALNPAQYKGTGPSVYIEWIARDKKADEIMQRLSRALYEKLVCSDSHGNRSARKIARQLVIDILARRKDIAPYHGIVDAFVMRGDTDFLRAVGRGSVEGRKPVFDEIEWFLIFHDGEMTDKDVAIKFDTTEYAVQNKRQRLGFRH